MGGMWAGRALEENAGPRKPRIHRGREVGAEPANMARNLYFLPTHPVDSDAQTYLEKIRKVVLELPSATESLSSWEILKRRK